MPTKNIYWRNGIAYYRFWVAGKEFRGSLRATTQAQAEKALKKVKAEVVLLRSGEERHTWPEAILGWDVEAPQTLKASVIERYKTSLRQVYPMLQALHVDQIDHKVIASLARRVGTTTEGKSRRAKITNATRRRDLTAVSSVLSYCVMQGWIESNPAKTWDRSVIKERRDPIVLPPEADIDLVIAQAPGKLGSIAKVAKLTGMRRDEVVFLKPLQVSAARRCINLTHTKTSRPRSVPVSDEVLQLLAAEPRHLSNPYIFWGELESLPTRNVSSRFGTLVRRIARDRQRDGKTFQPFRFHDLRHWFAVDYLRKGGSIYTLQKVLGHTSIQTTEIYLDYLTPEEAEQVKLGEMAR